nr:EFR1 family ferrodoxin [uncultured Peptoniphilus sp.]
MIYYFSGTGNSRHVAEVLGEKLETDLVDLGERIRAGNMDDIFDDTMIVVTPTYCYRMPRIVEDYLCGVSISAKKAYFVLTYGTTPGNAAHYAEKLAEKIGVSYGGTFSVAMPENYIAMFDAPGAEESREIIQKAEKKIRDVAHTIEKGEDQKNSSPWTGKLLSSINGIFYALFVKADKFYAKDNCIGCGECAKRCVLANVVMEEGRPTWLDRCTHCMACINCCPVEAIEYGKKSEGRFRYTFEKVKEK